MSIAIDGPLKGSKIEGDPPYLEVLVNMDSYLGPAKPANVKSRFEVVVYKPQKWFFEQVLGMHVVPEERFAEYEITDIPLLLYAGKAKVRARPVVFLGTVYSTRRVQELTEKDIPEDSLVEECLLLDRHTMSPIAPGWRWVTVPPDFTNFRGRNVQFSGIFNATTHMQNAYNARAGI